MRIVCAGLATWDVVHAVDRLPGPNEKVTASARAMAAGGPATNAAVVAAALGAEAVLVTAVGDTPVGRLIVADLTECGVDILDCTGDPGVWPALSAVTVSADGERSVVSANAVVPVDAGRLPVDLGQGSDVTLVDAHYPDLALAVLTASGTSVRVLDGGSVRAGTADLLAEVDVAVVSSDFHLDGAIRPADVLSALATRGVTRAMVTRGGEPVIFTWDGVTGAVPVPAVSVIDTLGAGDAFHGALAVSLARRGVRREHLAGLDIRTVISEAADVAALSVRSFGTRAWLEPVRRSARSEVE